MKIFEIPEIEILRIHTEIITGGSTEEILGGGSDDL